MPHKIRTVIWAQNTVNLGGLVLAAKGDHVQCKEIWPRTALKLQHCWIIGLNGIYATSVKLVAVAVDVNTHTGDANKSSDKYRYVFVLKL